LTVDYEVKITNVITENQKLKKGLKATRRKLDQLRKRLMNPYFSEPVNKNVEEDQTDSEKPPMRPRLYVEKLEKALARSHQMLDDKWFDLKQLSKMHL